MNQLHFTFEIINYFKCRLNGSSRPHLNQMLEFSLNRPTTTKYHKNDFYREVDCDEVVDLMSN